MLYFGRFDLSVYGPLAPKEALWVSQTHYSMGQDFLL